MCYGLRDAADGGKGPARSDDESVTYLNPLTRELLRRNRPRLVTREALGGRQTDKRRDGCGESGKDDQVASLIDCIFLLI